MGNQITINIPNTNKKMNDGLSDRFSYGVCEMQGWRPHMEDVTLVHIERDFSLFGVFDGHGGCKVAKFVANNFVQVLTNLLDFKNHCYEQALYNSYLKFDELLKIEIVNKVLNDYSKNSNNDEPQYSFLKFIRIKNNHNNEDVDKSLDLNLSDSNKLKHCKISSNMTLMKYKPSFLIEEKFQNKNDFYSDNEVVQMANQPLFPDTLEEHSIYSFGGVLIEESNQKITENLVSYFSGTTANVILIKANNLFIANAGDCLAVMYKNGRAIRLNKEHKVNLISERNRVLKAGKRIFNDRIEGKLNVSRSIGDFNFKNNNHIKIYDQAVISYPEVKKYKLTSDIEFIIMGSDGFWDCVDVQQICHFISVRLKEKTTTISSIISDIFDSILSKTIKSKLGTDNMSCIIIKLMP